MFHLCWFRGRIFRISVRRNSVLVVQHFKWLVNYVSGEYWLDEIPRMTILGFFLSLNNFSFVNKNRNNDSERGKKNSLHSKERKRTAHIDQYFSPLLRSGHILPLSVWQTSLSLSVVH